MEIIEHTSARLTLEDRPLVLAALLGGAILLLSGFALFRLFAGDLSGLWLAVVAAAFGLALVIFVRRTRVVFDRDTGRLALRVASLRGESVQNFALVQVLQASTETRKSRSGRNDGTVVMLHRVVLAIVGQAEPLPLMPVFVAGEGAALAAEAINHWLAQARTGGTAGT